MKYLFSNIFKGIRKKPLQVIGVVLLVTISTLAYIGMNFNVESLERGYNKMIEATNQQHFSSSINIDFSMLTKEEAIEITNTLNYDISDHEFSFKGQTHKYIDLYGEDLAQEVKAAGFYDLKKHVTDNLLKNRYENLDKIYKLFNEKYYAKMVLQMNKHIH